MRTKRIPTGGIVKRIATGSVRKIAVPRCDIVACKFSTIADAARSIIAYNPEVTHTHMLISVWIHIQLHVYSAILVHTCLHTHVYMYDIAIILR